KPGEYRYLRLAWKADGCAGVMVQLHDTDWNIRYTAGHNQYGWSTKFVADKAPEQWSLVTIDLFKDFGERTLTGIALTVFGGRAARKAAVGVKELRQWIRELDDRRFKVREAASARLAENLQVAAVLLEKELERGPNAEVRRRIQRLLEMRKGRDREAERVVKGV